MPVTTVFRDDHPCVGLPGDIDMPIAFELLDETNLIHDYYRFRTVELQINSPGGEVGALRYMVDGLKPWRNGNRILRTVGITEATSAAAISLSMGTLGHRFVYPFTWLLYHASRRIYGAQASQTSAELKLATHRRAVTEMTPSAFCSGRTLSELNAGNVV